MTYNIRMGIPEMAELWNRLQTSYRDGTINKKDAELYKKWGSAIKKLAMNPQYPSLKSHEIEPLSKRYGNDNPGAKSQGMKQLMAGGGVALIGTTLVPLLSGLF